MAAFRYLTALGVLVGLALSLAGFLGVWPGDVLTPFRPQLLLLALAALALSALLKRRWLIVLACIVVAANAFPMASRALGRPTLPSSGAEPGKAISVVF